jgi:DNA-binding NtrC family response regulator
VAHCGEVLVVDGLAETEAVLKAVLEPRGLHVLRVRAFQQPPHHRERHPRLVIIHQRDDQPEAEPPEDWRRVPQVVINSSGNAAAQNSEGRQYLQHPFDYPDLVLAVERLLEGHREAAAS